MLYNGFAVSSPFAEGLCYTVRVRREAILLRRGSFFHWLLPGSRLARQPDKTLHALRVYETGFAGLFLFSEKGNAPQPKLRGEENYEKFLSF